MDLDAWIEAEMVQHRARVEEGGPGRPDGLVCDADDQEWPCDRELGLRREEPDHV